MDWVSTDEFLRLTVQLQMEEPAASFEPRAASTPNFLIRSVCSKLVARSPQLAYRTTIFTSFFRNDNDLHNLLARDRRAHFLIGERGLLDLVLGCSRRHNHQAAQFSVDLHRNLDLVFRRQSRIVLRPWSFQQVASLAGHLPQFVRQIRSHGREQQSDVALHVQDQRRGNLPTGNCLLCSVNFVHQFHDGRDAGIEVPASLEIMADALDGLVQFALNRASLWRQRHCL